MAKLSRELALLRDRLNDTVRRTFVDRNGHALTRADLLARVTGRDTGAVGLNRRTAAARVLFDALARTARSRRPVVLAQVLQRPPQLVEQGDLSQLFQREASEGTNADKRHAVMLLLNDEEWGQWSNREIARRCSVAESSVRNYRDELSLRKLRSEPTPKTYTTKHGTVATMNTENIVKRAC